MIKACFPKLFIIHYIYKKQIKKTVKKIFNDKPRQAHNFGMGIGL
jgi:hypothetical protein